MTNDFGVIFKRLSYDGVTMLAGSGALAAAR